MDDSPFSIPQLFFLVFDSQDERGARSSPTRFGIFRQNQKIPRPCESRVRTLFRNPQQKPANPPNAIECATRRYRMRI